MINAIIEYFKGPNNYRIAQEVIGLKYLFQGFICHDWFGVSNTKKYTRQNKIIIRECIKFYHSYWMHQNDTYHMEEKQKQIL